MIGDFKLLWDKVLSYNPKADYNLLKGAYDFALAAHIDQVRASGEPYFIHPFSVAILLTELQMDEVCLAAALLHDVVEDTPFTMDIIEARFGAEVANLVDGVTKIGKLLFNSKEERQAENIRKMLLAVTKDVRVILIKLADRLHNIRTLDFLDQRKRRAIAQETLEIYAPLANRLGIHRFKWELEDQAFKNLEPDIYAELSKNIASQKGTRDAILYEIQNFLGEQLKISRISAEITGRSKHFYSIYLKMRSHDRDISEIYDLMAVRILVDSVRECYGVLGIVHETWPPLPGRFKDYIAVPKPNRYQSLHTTVIHPRGMPLEIQIRTHKMHETAEIGIASHWVYKEGVRSIDPAIQNRISWLRQLLEWQGDILDAREWVNQVKTDLFSDEVFVFTPAGNMKVLKDGSTPVDFAYSVHSEVGHCCIGAKVNGKIVPLNHSLENGDVIEILTSKKSSPSPGWLDFVQTSRARNKIRAWQKQQQRDDNIQKGHKILQNFWIQIIQELGDDVEDRMDPAKSLRNRELEGVAKGLELPSPEALLLAVAQGSLSPRVVFTRMFPEQARNLGRKPIPQIDDDMPMPSRGSLMDSGGLHDMSETLIRLAICCNPVPGDEIVGYITRGRGLSVHRKDCPNLRPLAQEEERLVQVTWDNTRIHTGVYHVKIRVECIERPGLLNDITSVVSFMKLNIHSLSATPGNDTNVGIVDMVIQIQNSTQIEELTANLHKVKGVLRIYRLKNPGTRAKSPKKSKSKN